MKYRFESIRQFLTYCTIMYITGSQTRLPNWSLLMRTSYDPRLSVVLGLAVVIGFMAGRSLAVENPRLVRFMHTLSEKIKIHHPAVQFADLRN